MPLASIMETQHDKQTSLNPPHEPEEYLYLRCSPGSLSVGRYVTTTAYAHQQRERVSAFSERSRSRLVRYLEECTAEYSVMGTLTVGEYSADGRLFKQALDKWLCWAMRHLGKAQHGAPPSIFWFLEFQKRGAPHVHLYSTGFIEWRAAAVKWAWDCMDQPEIFSSSTQFEAIKTGRGGQIAYARKYAAKLDQKEVPDEYMSVGRFWGVRGCSTVKVAVCRVKYDAIRRLGLECDVQAMRSLVSAMSSRKDEARTREWSDGHGVLVKRNWSSASGVWSNEVIAAVNIMMSRWLTSMKPGDIAVVTDEVSYGQQDS